MTIRNVGPDSSRKTKKHNVGGTNKAPREKTKIILDPPLKTDPENDTKPPHINAELISRIPLFQKTTSGEEENEGNDILNEKVSTKSKQRAENRAIEIMSKYKNDQHKLKNPTSKESWLMHTIRTVISAADRIILLHKYKF